MRRRSAVTKYAVSAGNAPQASANQNVVVEASAEELEVVRDDDEAAEGDEARAARASHAIAPTIADARPRRRSRRAASADERRRRGIRVCSGRPVQLVERVRADADREEERGERGAEPRPGERRRERGADRDIAQVPERVRRVEERDVVAPAARRKRVERRPRLASLTRAVPRSRPAAEAQPATRTSSTPASRQSAELPVERQSRVEVADARPEEPSHLVPARPDGGPRNGQPDADVQLPGRARQSAARAAPNSRVATVPPGRTTRASSHERRAGVVDVAQEVRDRQRVEGCRRRTAAPRRVPRRAGCPSCGPRARFARGLGQHLGALVDPDDRAAVRPDELDRHGSRAGGDVEHRCRRPGLDPRDQEAPPARVLAEREQPRVAVVGRAERREELPSRPGASRCGLRRVYSRKVSLNEELERIAAAAAAERGRGRDARGSPRRRAASRRTRVPVRVRGGREPFVARARRRRSSGHEQRAVRDAASIAALCELAEEIAAGGDLDDLISQLVAVRLTEAPAGIEEAEEAARDLQRTIEPPPRLASPDYLDRIGDAAAATRARAGRRRLAVRRGNEVRDGSGRPADARDRRELQRRAFMR